VRYLWLITALMGIAGITLTAVSVPLGLGPVGLVGGVLLLWSTVVKVIVLKIWRGTLNAGSTPQSQGITTSARAAAHRQP